MEFAIISCPDMQTFIDAINLALRDGWQLHGGMCMDMDYYFYQAIVRKAETGDKKESDEDETKNEDGEMAAVLAFQGPKDQPKA